MSYAKKLWDERDQDLPLEETVQIFMPFAYENVEGGIQEELFDFLISEFGKFDREQKSVVWKIILSAISPPYKGKESLSPFRFNSDGLFEFVEKLYGLIDDKDEFLIFDSANSEGFWWFHFVINSAFKMKECPKLSDFFGVELGRLVKRSQIFSELTNGPSADPGFRRSQPLELRILNALKRLSLWENQTFQRSFFNNADVKMESYSEVLNNVIWSNLEAGDLKFVLDWLNQIGELKLEEQCYVIKNMCKLVGSSSLLKSVDKILKIPSLLDAMHVILPLLEDSGVRDRENFAENKQALENFTLMHGLGLGRDINISAAKAL